MLDYELPEVPKKGQRWFIRAVGSGEYRYLVLQRKNVLGFWVKVYEELISEYTIGRLGFRAATHEAARRILWSMRVNFNLPTGVVR